MPQWEYKQIFAPYHSTRTDDVETQGLLGKFDTGFMVIPEGFNPDFEEQLNQLGKDGWEVVVVTPREGGRFVQNPSGSGLAGYAGGFSFTLGVEIFCKRPLG